MSTSSLCLAEIKTHDPAGRRITLYIDVDTQNRTVAYKPVLDNGEMVGLNHVFRLGAQLPKIIYENEENEKIMEIKKHIRYFNTE